MKLHPMADGDLTNHLGLSHAWCHYANPREMWEDIVPNAVPPEARPQAVWEAVQPTPPPHPESEGSLRTAYRHGYFPTVASLVEPLPQVGAPWSRHPTKPRLRRAHVGDGVVVYLQGDRLHTAFRPVDFKIPDYRCPPRDAKNVSIRRSVAASHAAAYLSQKRRTNSYPEPE
jgi:hypothetical protein